MTVDVLIPVYRPGKKFARLLAMLAKQTVQPAHIIVINTERGYWKEEGFAGVRGLMVHHITKEDFDHGATRNLAAWYSEAGVMVFMTDDAVPQDVHLLEKLLEGLDRTGPRGERAAVAYARQLPAKDCGAIERLSRGFNYPAQGCVKTAADLERLGIKTFFASNACCAYRKDIFEELDGFVTEAIFNEDMLYAAKAVMAGYAVVYAPEAKVVHSHNFTCAQQFRRNFDLAVSQADHPEVFAAVSSEKEGIRMVKETALGLLKRGRFWLLPALVLSCGARFIGYQLGKQYKRLPKKALLFCTASPLYWEKKWRAGR